MAKWIHKLELAQKAAQEHIVWQADISLNDDESVQAYYISKSPPREVTIKKKWPTLVAFQSERFYPMDETITPCPYDLGCCGEECRYVQETAETYRCNKFNVDLRVSRRELGVMPVRPAACIKSMPKLPDRIKEKFNRELGLVKE